jgi:hypothetical protein
MKMKKSCLVFCLSFLVINVFSQHKKNVRIGFLLEPTISWFNPNENGVKADGSKFGVNYGLMLDYEFAENYIFSTGLQVAHLGGNLSYTGNIWKDKKVGLIAADNSSANNTGNYKLSVQYLQLPFALKLRTDGKGLKFWGSFGGFLGVPISARTDFETNFSVNGVANYKQDNQNILSDVIPINIGMQLGAGVEIPISAKNVLVGGLMFNNGFIDVTKNGSWGDDGKINMNNLALKIGVFF